MVSNDHGKAYFRDTMLQASTVVEGAISSVRNGLSAAWC